MIRLAILGSTRGTNLTAIVEAINQKRLNASIELIISNKSNALILERAANFGLNALFVNPKGLSREDYDKHLSQILKESKIDLIVLIGYMRILSPLFVSDWEKKIINIHPSLLPAYSGLMNLDVHQAVLDAAETVTGCTVHVVNEEVDAGPIILQKSCPVLKDDTAESLKDRVQQLEGSALVEAIQKITKAF
ncbi:Phosphoribosylglycinamide formyltransferase [Legionella massiliensis]|uniref:Phosphoribosylglycinamide formyltransferase n=1 Tax=Legionella massiliensis TaxID=1034943 RepID=A0A078KTV1_9GAMM|nr:phosphoribosylglycinamide formyltransferase [Legionella massiliensis]CDZ77880.1 Phosphoribosylglycinamide formyltransferase [Legionella massiliensis]CEE13618.1 Phosphoribosylglycinamide formyltransferase [Legionella massiliensis]